MKIEITKISNKAIGAIYPLTYKQITPTIPAMNKWAQSL